MKIEWVDGFEIKVAAENGEIVISAELIIERVQ